MPALAVCVAAVAAAALDELAAPWFVEVPVPPTRTVLVKVLLPPPSVAVATVALLPAQADENPPEGAYAVDTGTTTTGTDVEESGAAVVMGVTVLLIAEEDAGDVVVVGEAAGVLAGAAPGGV